MVVCFQKLKIRFALIVALCICAGVLASSALAQKSKPKENSNPKICTGGVINSKVTFEAKPIYPKEAIEARAEGQIPVMVRVDENGKIYEATACTGHKLLRQAAVDAAYKTQITPTVISGKPYKIGGILLYEFKIKEGKSGLVDTKRAQQINGREGETATFLSRCPLNSELLGGGFAPRHLNRYAASCHQRIACRRTKIYHRFMNYHDIITIEPGKRGGKPCIRGMRMTVYDVLEYLASGMTTQEILDDFPYLTHDDIMACLAFAADREKNLLVVQP